MGLFGNSNKSKVVVKTQQAGSAVKRVKFAVGANVIIGLFTLIEQLVGSEILPDDLKNGIANLIVTGIALVFDYLSYKKAKNTPENSGE